MKQPTITKITVPAYRVVAETRVPDCFDCLHPDEPGITPLCKEESFQACADDCGQHWKVQEISKTFRSKQAAVKFAAWTEYNNRRFPKVGKIFPKETSSQEEWDEKIALFEQALMEVKAIAKELFGIKIR